MQAFWRVTFPLLLPGIAAAAMLAFCLCFDDFIVTNFASGTSRRSPSSSTSPRAAASRRGQRHRLVHVRARPPARRRRAGRELAAGARSTRATPMTRRSDRVPDPVRVLMVGAGGVGDAAARIAVERDFFEAWWWPTSTSGGPSARSRRRADDVGRGAVHRRAGRRLDADAVAALARELRATHVLNAVDPRFVMPIFAGALAAGRPLPRHGDVAVRAPPGRAPTSRSASSSATSSSPGPASGRPPGGSPSLGIGVEPGLSDVFARYAADDLFDHIDELGVRDGANLVIRDDDGNDLRARRSRSGR